MNKPILSICIATYNRSDYISETLNSIIPQLDDDTELLIVDGASTDHTQNIVEEFVKKDSRIRYIRLATKGGVDQDYDKSVELARGEFCWLFTDDDLLKPGAISAVKELLPKGYDLIIVNAEVCNKDLSKVIESHRVKIQKNKLYFPDDTDNFFIDVINHISFIGAVVIRRSVWLDRNRESYFGTDFIHVGVIFEKKIKTPILVMSDPFISIRWGNAQWSPRGFDIWMFKWPKLIWSFNIISSEAKHRIINPEPWRSLKFIAFQRRMGHYSMQSYKTYLSKQKINYGLRIFYLIIAIFPRKLFSFIYDFLYKIKNKKSQNY